MDSIETSYDTIVNKLNGWYDMFIDKVPNMVMAVLVFVVFFILSKWARKGLRKLMERSSFSQSLTNLMVAILGFTISTIGLFIALEIMDLGKAVTSLLAGIGVLAMALGFAFQEIASNMISGVILAFNSPMNEGDMIEAHGFIGTVKHIGLRSTTIISPQGQNIQIPNRMIFQNPFTNFTETGERRLDVSCGISYGDDLEKVEKLVLETVSKVEGVITKGAKKPFFFYDEFGDSSINFKVFLWLEQTSQPFYSTVKSETIKSLKSAFDANDITIPFPIRTLDFGIKGGQKLDSMLKK